MVNVTISRVSRTNENSLIVFTWNGRAVAVKRMKGKSHHAEDRKYAIRRTFARIPEGVEVEVLPSGEALGRVVSKDMYRKKMLVTGRFPSEDECWEFFEHLEEWYRVGNFPKSTDMAQVAPIFEDI